MIEGSSDNNMHLSATIHELSLLVGRLFNHAVKDIGLTRTQWMVLYRLYQDGEQNQTHLANKLSMAKPPLGKVLEKLEADGWITRCQNSKDRRENLVTLTEKVSPLIEPLTKVVTDIGETGVSTLNKKEQAALTRFLVEVRRNLLSAIEAQT